MLAEALRARGAASLADSLEELRADEVHHLRFQGAFFRSRAPGWLGPVLRLLWWPLITGAVALLLFDQRATFRAFGLRWSRLVKEYGRAAVVAGAEMKQRAISVKVLAAPVARPR